MIMKQNGLIGSRKKKKRKRINLRHIKDRFKVFQHNSIDTKHLKDMELREKAVYGNMMEAVNS